MDSETWRFINTFAPWFSAIGTIAAVIVSLYLARARRPIKLEVRSGHRILVGDSSELKYPEYIFIGAINVGHRVAYITNVGWKTGCLKKIHAIMTIQENRYSWFAGENRRWGRGEMVYSARYGRRELDCTFFSGVSFAAP